MKLHIKGPDGHFWIYRRAKVLLAGMVLLCIHLAGRTQSQACPLNVSFSQKKLDHWEGYTGNNVNGNGPSAIQIYYDSTRAAPGGTLGALDLPEFNLPSVMAVQVIYRQGTDPFGGFETIPTINGYAYQNSILLGSTAVSEKAGPSGGHPGGYIRGISYRIHVPTSAVPQPYTMTYAYAMVLENGTHNSNEQPLFSATLSVHDSVITCASPQYYLPTSNTASQNGRGAVLDTAAALSAGFRLSPKPSPNASPIPFSTQVEYQQDVWAKGWTEVTFDLSAYRGQDVVLTFESDNCIPGGHFAYAYIALRNACAGLQISGNPVACTSSEMTYSIPALAGAAYHWSIPSDWTLNSSPNNNIIKVQAGVQPGTIIAEEINGCAHLTDTIQVTTTAPTIPGQALSDTIVCAGINLVPLQLTANRGSVLRWIASVDGQNWDSVGGGSLVIQASNLNQTTAFRALVQNGPSCPVDSSGQALVTVDAKSRGGKHRRT